MTGGGSIYVSVPITLSDLERVNFFQAVLLNNARTRTTKFGRITRGEGRVL